MNNERLKELKTALINELDPQRHKIDPEIEAAIEDFIKRAADYIFRRYVSYSIDDREPDCIFTISRLRSYTQLAAKLSDNWLGQLREAVREDYCAYRKLTKLVNLNSCWESLA